MGLAEGSYCNPNGDVDRHLLLGNKSIYALLTKLKVNKGFIIWPKY